jgi:hypothetical protein
MIEIHDNLVDENYANRLRNILLSPNFPWYYLPETTPLDGKHDFGTLTHIFDHIDVSNKKSEYIGTALTLLDLFSVSTGYKIDKIIRSRSNLVIGYPGLQDRMSDKHIDYDIPHHVILYYVCGNANTVFFNEDGSIMQEVESKTGRFVIFNGSLMHSIRIPDATRVVFNFNVILK